MSDPAGTAFLRSSHVGGGDPALPLVVDAAACLLASREPDRACREFFVRIADHLGCDIFTNFALEDDELRLEESNGFDADTGRSLARLRLGEQLCGVCAERVEFLYLTREELERHPQASALAALGVQVYAAVPLISNGQLLGTLAFASRRRTAFTTDDLELVRAIAYLVAAAKARRRADAELRESEERLRLFSDHATAALFNIGPGGVIVDVNRQACESLGYTREELIGMTVGAIDPFVSAATLEALTAAMARGETFTLHSEHQRRDGTCFPVEIRTRPYVHRGVRHALALAEDITQRQEAELALRSSEQALRHAQALAKVGSWTLDLESGLVTASPEALRICGLEGNPVDAETQAALVHPDDRERVSAAWDVARGGSPFRVEHRVVTPAGETRWCEVRAEPERTASGRVVRLVGTTQDVTERRMLEERLRHAEKMEAMGQLAGGVAHDFNNLLTVINGFSDIVLGQLPRQDSTWEAVAAIRDAGQRAAQVTSQLLAFGRRQVLEPAVVDLNRVVCESEDFVRRLVGPHIALTIVPAPNLWHVRVDPGQIDQVLMNLAINARDAMPDGGRITIATRNYLARGATAGGEPLAFAGEASGRSVLLEVQDTGTGMSPDTKSKVFEPFFTTKASGKGTGLGLATVYGIVTQSGGSVSVESELGRGTFVTVVLPACTDLPEERPSEPTPLRGAETVLVVEDEVAVRQVVRHSLERAGYRVVLAENPVDALRRVRAAEPRVHLLLSDVVMPAMGGRELADQLRAIDSNLRVLFMSGYADDAILRNGVSAAADSLIQKPFTPTDLVRRVRAVLDA